jgi:MoxR-like ATPases
MSAIQLVENVKKNIGKVIVGKEAQAEEMLLALVCGGHVLIEDVPGLGKTTLVTALARSLNCTYSRIQFTSDLLPSDVTGYTAFNPKTGEREVCFGGLMAQIVLADEINRTSPKTQSSLLEAMQEAQLTIDGKTYPLPTPFIVLATQNPVEHTGTYPLPEAQLDRFFMQISLGYPTHAEEIDILKRNMRARPIDELEPVASAEDILALREERKKVICADAVLDYIIQIAEATRKDERISLGISPRGCIALTEAAMANALFSGRDYTLPDDVQKLAVHVLAHRLVLDRRSGVRGESRSSILTSIIREIKVPAVS